MHAFLIIAHNKFQQLKKLIETLDSPDHDIYIHIDKKAGDIDIASLNESVKHSRITFIERMSVIWGDYTQIECEMHLIKAAVQNRKYQYIHLLSGVDMPIKSQKYMHEFFDKHNGKQFLHFESYNMAESECEKVRYWFPFQKYIGRKGKNESVLYYIQRFLIKCQKLMRINRHHNESIKFYKGANWFSITSEFAEYVLSKEEFIKKTFKFSKCCDEIFLQTIIMNSKYQSSLYLKTFCDDYRGCVRYIDWKRGRPYIFRKEDFNDLVTSEYIFARKFDIEIDSEVIDALYELRCN